jgi:hypothetical protein
MSAQRPMGASPLTKPKKGGMDDMKMKHIIVVNMIALSNNMLGMNGIELLQSYSFVDSVSVTPTNLTVSLSAFRNSFLIIQFPENERHSHQLEPYEVLVLMPNQEARIVDRDVRTVFTPVSFKNHQKGFRVSCVPVGVGAYRNASVITYIVLSDTPQEMNENDVKEVMDNGKWMKAEDSKSLELEKLGWRAEKMIQNAEKILQDTEMMARVLGNAESVELWNTLAERGFIKAKTFSASHDYRQSEKPNNEAETSFAVEIAPTKPNNLWLYAGISLCVLVPILYFLRKKLLTRSKIILRFLP